VIWGIGATFISGAEEAWLADEIGESRLTDAYLRGSQVSLLGTLAGILFSVRLGTTALNLPILFGGMCIVGLALFLALFMSERGFQPTPMPERSTWQKMGATLRSGAELIQGQRLLRIILAIAAIYGLSSEGLDRLWEAHFLANFSFPAIGDPGPVGWFGIINVVQIILTFAATEFVRRRLQGEDQRAAVRVLLVVNMLFVISLIVFGLALNFAVAVVAIWAVFVFRRTSGPLYAAWLNKELKPSTRATVLSFRGQIDAVGQLIGGPIIGLIALQFSLRAAMIGVAMMLLPAVWLYARALRYYIPLTRARRVEAKGD
jgi:DHA3 family tetracycline resistance protein-like MFS transporter